MKTRLRTIRRLTLLLLLALFITFSVVYTLIQHELMETNQDEIINVWDVPQKIESVVVMKSKEINSIPASAIEDINDTIHWAPFDNVSPANPKLVILLSYQRCGSTLLSQLFNQNPLFFFHFEPLDALYSAMFGTTQGWNVPSDITTYSNGTRRKLPQWEIDQVSNFLQHILLCNVDLLPTECLVHQYQTLFPAQYKTMMHFVECIIKNVPKRCHNTLERRTFCGKRFGVQTETRLEECRRLMINAGDRQVDASIEIRKDFLETRKCMLDIRKTVDQSCRNLLLGSCKPKSMRAVKVVRATMQSMDSLLKRLPNLRIIHLVRDPRGVTLSRYNLNASVRSLYAGAVNGTEILIREAEVYCRAVSDDLIERAKLELRYPGRIMGVSYDFLVTDLERYIGKIYKFLDLPHAGVRAAANSMRVKVTPGGTNGTKKISTIANYWRTALNSDMRLRILNVCKDFFDLSEFEWRI